MEGTLLQLSVDSSHLISLLTVYKAAGILTCDNPTPPLYGDVTPKESQDAIVMSILYPSYASWHSPCPRAS
ncbi:hypothetical protein MFRU_008g03310 [Monilinia fructicola]|nr:hypothetical protein MFRU_008g03310 [Monilinia fructicola]